LAQRLAGHRFAVFRRLRPLGKAIYGDVRR
jgi:hypothetical protein